MAPRNASSAHPATSFTPLARVLVATFFGSVSGGAFWSAMFFVSARVHHFSPLRNLVLACVLGAAYTVWAWSAGWLTRGPLGRLAPRTSLLLVLATWAAAAVLPACAPTSELLFWLATLVGTSASAVVWPLVESFMSAGRHGPELRKTIGWFNVTWTPAVAVPLLLMPWVTRLGPLASIWTSALCNGVAMVAVAGFPARPAHHDPERSRQSVGADYRFLRDATRWLLPLAYLMAAVLSPVLPARLLALGVQPDVAPVLASTWMVSRFATLALLAATSFWHGRWSTLLGGGVALGTGMACALLAPTAWLFTLALTVFGAGMAVLYYASLYYGLAVGHAQVDAGGTFEGLVGLGYFLGPALGIAGYQMAGAARGEVATVALTWLIALASLAGPLRAWRRSVAAARARGE